MTTTDIACIVIASVALTLAAALVAFHLYLRSYRRTLANVREQRGRWYDEARRLRADRPAVHRHLAAAEPIPYQLADRAAYLPAFDGDNPAVREYAELADAIRQAGKVAG